MKVKTTKKIDFSRKRLAYIADEYYNEGKYVSALRFAHREMQENGGDEEVYARLCDIYEGMGLHGTAINYWFKFLDIAKEEDLPDVYESLATNFLAMGNERQAAYYYNRLIDSDDQIPQEAKMEIADAFATDKRSGYRFVYPPQLVDYSKELNLGSKALKLGDSKRAIEILDEVAKGSKDYASAKEMQAIAHLLQGETEKAEEVCMALLADQPDAVRVMATLAAVYLEQGRKEESLALAKKLATMEIVEQDDIYKIATVCCENGLHEEAYKRFCILDEKARYDGRILYFKGVSAYNCGKLKEAENAFAQLTTIYPDAEVAKYYLRALRNYMAKLEGGENPTPPELIYFYHLPQEEREDRCQTLLKIGAIPKDEAQLFGLIALHDGYFAWCFDEMDGGDRDLQYLGLVTATHVRADEFLQDVLLDFEVADVLKIEVLRMLIERNEDMDVGLVLCSVYKRVAIDKVKIGRKRRKKFIEAYAKILSKFAAIDPRYSGQIRRATENLYERLEGANALDLVDNTDDLACTIYFLANLKDLGKDHAWIASAFDANVDKVHVLLSYTPYVWGRTETKEKENESD